MLSFAVPVAVAVADASVAVAVAVADDFCVAVAVAVAVAVPDLRCRRLRFRSRRRFPSPPTFTSSARAGAGSASSWAIVAAVSHGRCPRQGDRLFVSLDGRTSGWLVPTSSSASDCCRDNASAQSRPAPRSTAGMRTSGIQRAGRLGLDFATFMRFGPPTWPSWLRVAGARRV